jgi:hypothetical protein
MTRWGWLRLTVLGSGALVVGLAALDGSGRVPPELDGAAAGTTAGLRVLAEARTSIGPGSARASASRAIHAERSDAETAEPHRRRGHWHARSHAMLEPPVSQARQPIARDGADQSDDVPAGDGVAGAIERQRTAMTAALLYLMSADVPPHVGR